MHEKIRIMHVAWGLDKGGVEELLFITAKFNLQQKYEVAFTTWASKKGVISEKIEKLGYPVFELNVSSRILDLRAVPKLLRILRTYRPDIVHFYAKIGFSGRIVAKLAGVPHIICNEVDLFARNASLNLRLLAVLKRHTDFLADKVIACSKAVRQYWDPKNSSRYTIMYLPIDTGKLSVTPVNTSAHGGPFKTASAPVIGIVSRMHPGKGHEYLIKAMPQILNAYPNARLRVIGTGILQTELENLARSLNISLSVDFKGFVEDLFPEFFTMDLFVLPSLSEGFPLSIMEAMAMGVPVAATPVGGIPELIIPGETGELFAEKDPDSLAETVIRMLGDYENTVATGLRGKNKVLSECTPEAYIKNLDCLYQELLREE